MSQNIENRVLSRVHGRQLSAAEVDQVNAGFKITNSVCTFNFTTCQADQDCDQIPQCP